MAGQGSLPLLGTECIQIFVQKVNYNQMHLCFVSCQGKTIDTSKSDVMERESSVGLTDPPLVNKLNSTVVPVKTKQAYLPEHEGEHFSLLNTYTRTAGGKVWAASSNYSSFFFLSCAKYMGTSEELPCMYLRVSGLYSHKTC